MTTTIALVSWQPFAATSMAGLCGLFHLSSEIRVRRSLHGFQSGLPLASRLPFFSAGCQFLRPP